MLLSDNTDFIFSKPNNKFLNEIVLSYFYLNMDVADISFQSEHIIPYPRVTIGYFFDHPFNVYNASRNELKVENSLVSKVTKDRIIVSPTSNRIKILGVHLKPYALALFSDRPANTFQWCENTFEIFGIKSKRFNDEVRKIKTVSKLFDLIEHSLLDSLRVKDYALVSQLSEIVDHSNPLLSVAELAKQSNLSERTLRNHFQSFIGCSPKEYIQIVRLKRAVSELLNSKNKLTDTGYNSGFYDQAHFIKSLKNDLGKIPKEIKKDIESSRFFHFS